MQAFGFVAAESTAEARAAHAGRADAEYLAGGTTLIDLMKAGVERPALVVDINALPLASIAVTGDCVRIGAMARNSDVAYDPTIAQRLPALAQALLAGASGQLRNMATVGGNLLQRTRCPYFRDEASACNKRTPGSGCDAIDGFNRAHAILGGSGHCIATHASDMAVPLAAFDAQVVVEGGTGETTIPFDDFYRLPGDRPDRENALERGDLIVGVDVTLSALHQRSVYLKLRDRASYEFALVSVAVAVELDGAAIRAARIALGGVATVPWRAREAEQTLTGARAGEDAFRRAAEAALTGAAPRRHNAFKVDLAKRAVARALRMVTA